MYDRLTSTAIETIHAMTNTAETGRVMERGRGLKNVMETAVFPISYRSFSTRRVGFRPEGPGEKPLCVIQGNLTAESVWQRIERMLGPREFEQNRRRARVAQAVVQRSSEAGFDDVIAGAVEEQRRRHARARVGHRRRLAVSIRGAVRRAAQIGLENRAHIERIGTGRLAPPFDEVCRPVVADDRAYGWR